MSKTTAYQQEKAPLLGDITSTARARAHLERLGDAKGKRLVVDLDATARTALEGLFEAGSVK